MQRVYGAEPSETNLVSLIGPDLEESARGLESFDVIHRVQALQ